MQCTVYCKYTVPTIYCIHTVPTIYCTHTHTHTHTVYTHCTHYLLYSLPTAHTLYSLPTAQLSIPAMYFYACGTGIPKDDADPLLFSYLSAGNLGKG